MRSKSKVKKTSSRITNKRGIKTGLGKKKSKVTQKKNTSTSPAIRKKVTSARRPKKLKIKRQKPQRHKTTLKKEILVKRSSGRVEKFDTNRLAQTVSRSGVPFLMARDIAKKATKKIKSQIKSPTKKTTV